eukprot:363664-Chlamydomonas_euryale.AAC.6
MKGSCWPFINQHALQMYTSFAIASEGATDSKMYTSFAIASEGATDSKSCAAPTTLFDSLPSYLFGEVGVITFARVSVRHITQGSMQA